MAHGGPIEIIDEVAAPLPAEMIGLLLGFPAEMRPKLQEWSERTIALGGGPRYMNEQGIVAAMEFAQAASDLYDAKKGCPVSRAACRALNSTRGSDSGLAAAASAVGVFMMRQPMLSKLDV